MQDHAERPKLAVLSNELIERIIDEAEEILEKVGIGVRDERGLNLLAEGGARIDRGKQHAFIPRSLIEKSLKTIPSSIKLYDRSGNLKADLGENNVYFCPMVDVIKTWDENTQELRGAVTKDYIDFVIVNDALDNIAVQTATYYPTDVPEEIQGCYRNFLSLKYGTKPTWGDFPPTDVNIQGTIDLVVAIRGSEEAVREKPLLLNSAPSTSPLQWDSLSLSLIIEFAKRNLPIIISPSPLMGSTGPVTMCGAITQIIAEELSGLVITQLVSPGALAMPLHAPEVFDMRSSNASMGAIELSLVNLACVQVTRYLGIPSTVMLGTSDAKRPDSQSGLEAGFSLVLGALTEANLISGPGVLGAGLVGSLEKLVIDNEICGMAYRLLKGITLRGERLAEDLFTEGLLEGTHFLLSPTTRKWFREEVRYPGNIISRESADTWQKQGSTTAEQRAREEVQRILAEHKQEPLDPDVDREITNIVTSYARKYGMDKLPLMP